MSRRIPLGVHTVSHHTLDNGLEVLLLDDPASPVVAFQVWFKVGSRNEREGKTGIAHLFEHLMFGETGNLAKGEFDRRVEAVGASMNAATWLDWTCYHETFLPEHLPMIAELEAERMARLVLGDEQVATEKEVVANERRFRVEDSVEGAANEALWAAAFVEHPYHHPTIGWMDDIRSFTAQECRDFYRTYYAPNNACVVIVGDVREKDALDLVRRTHGWMARQEVPPDRPAPEPAQTSERVVRITRPTPTPKVSVAWKSPALRDPAHAAVTVLAQVLLGGRSGRLQRKLVHDGEIASDAQGGPGAFRDPSLTEIWIDLREGRTQEEALERTFAEVASISREAPSGEEIETARNQVLLALRSGLETAEGRADRIGFFHVTAGDAGAVARRQEELLRVGPEDVRAAAERCLRPETRTIVYVDPAAAGDAEGGP